MLSGLERHISVVSLLLMAGAGLILLEGPVGANYLHQVLAPKQVENEMPKSADAHPAPDSQTPVARTTHLDTKLSTWATTVDNASPLHSSVLGEIPFNTTLTPKFNSAPSSK